MLAREEEATCEISFEDQRTAPARDRRRGGRVGISVVLISVVLAELLGSNVGLGFELQRASNTLQNAKAFPGADAGPRDQRLAVVAREVHGRPSPLEHGCWSEAV